MGLNFIGRENELQFLESRYSSNQFEFIVIYGRRRIGKTTLIKKFLEEKNTIYFLCDKAGTERNADRFKRKIATVLDEPPIESTDLYNIFEYLLKKAHDRTILVFDEFPYLVEKDNGIPSMFQLIVDEYLKNSTFMLILCGSSLSMMEKGVLSKKSPLYGRKTGHIKLQEFSFEKASEFFPSNSIMQNVECYSILGGVPHYLEKFDESREVLTNIKEEIMSKNGRLYEEIEFLLKEEFRQPDIYRNILSVIASGATRVVDIANKSSILPHNLPKYLNSLLSLGIIKKEYSMLDKTRKRPRYYIDDNLTNFWFTFCEPFKSDLEVMDHNYSFDYLEQNFNGYIGHRFEEIVRHQYLRKIIPFQSYQLGIVWYGPIEIDGMALAKGKKRAVFIEIKYKDNVNGRKLKRSLEDKVQNLPIKIKDISYLFVARSFSNKTNECYSFSDLVSMNP